MAGCGKSYTAAGLWDIMSCMSSRPHLSWATGADYADLADVMFDAVRHGRSGYTEAQRETWAPHVRSGSEWQTRLERQDIIIARQDGVAVGFMSLDAGGYIDFAFIRPDAQGTGLFRRLYQRIERRGMDRNNERLWVHASLMAQPAFTAIGFELGQQQVVEIGAESFKRAEMEKKLSASGER